MQAGAAGQFKPQLIDTPAAMLAFEAQQHVLDAWVKGAQLTGDRWSQGAWTQALPAVLLVDAPEFAHRVQVKV